MIRRAAYDKEAGGGDESRILKIARCMTRSGGACKWFVLILLKRPICIIVFDKFFSEQVFNIGQAFLIIGSSCCGKARFSYLSMLLNPCRLKVSIMLHTVGDSIPSVHLIFQGIVHETDAKLCGIYCSLD
jgi:hypothetical protein